METPTSIERVIDALASLPGIGKRAAERIAYYLADDSQEDIDELLDSIVSMKEKLHECPVCGAITDEEKCPICTDNDRDHQTLMVVSYSKDVTSIEKSKQYNGLYHVIKGVVSPSKGVGVEDLNIQSLIERIKKEEICEVIVATNPTLDGETTAQYIADILQPLDVKVTRLGYGLQIGGSLDYVDAMTLGKALSGRTKL
ncbi:MAG: recombination mediator RecR [Coprobacillus sp.]|nr:recombination mediator RecR [Coprobacillus sp.]